MPIKGTHSQQVSMQEQLDRNLCILLVCVSREELEATPEFA